MEAISNSIEDKLIDSLQFKLKEGASYINDRRSVTFHASGSNVYSSRTGQKLIKIQLTGDNWLDPSTVRVMFDLVNLDPEPKLLRPVGGCHAFFRRCRLLCGGQVVEDLDHFGRVSEMMHTLQSKASRANQFAEGYGNEMTIDENYRNIETGNIARDYHGIPGKQKMTMMFRPLLGMFMQDKYLPLAKMGTMTLELELVDDPGIPVLKPFDTVPDPVTGVKPAVPDSDAVGIKNRFVKENTTMNWSIENAQIKCDVITLDNQLQNSYDSHLLAGNAYPINYNTFITQTQSVNGNKLNINISRSVTRLKSVFCTLDSVIDYEQDYPARKGWNDFYSPMFKFSKESYTGNNAKFDEKGEFTFQMQIGSKKFPETEMRSHQESFYQLKKCLGIQASAVHSLDISPHEYRNSKLIIGIDTEKQLTQGFTGINTRAGDQLTIALNLDSRLGGGVDKVDDKYYAKEIYVTLHTDNVLEIKESGISIYD